MTPASAAHAADARDLGWTRLACGALLVFAGYYAGCRLGFAFTFSPNPISIMWPPNAVLMAGMLLAPARAWPVLVLAALPVGSSRVDLQACKLEYSIVSPK